MALKFGESKGGAIKDRADSYKMKDGSNRLRLVGDLLARYVYWLKGSNNKPLPVECLSFDRQEEKFTNVETDHVPSFYPDMKCSWAYAIQAIDLSDPTNPKLTIFNLKKKLLGQIMDLAEDLGDPTDPDKGWDIIFDKKKTGPLAINVEYKLKERQIEPRPLNEAEHALLVDLKSMDTVLPRPTADKVKEFLEKINSGSTENVDEEVGAEFANVE